MEYYYYLIIVYSIFFIGTIMFSVLINGLFLKFSQNLGIRSNDPEMIIRWSSTSKPAMGGIGFYVLFLLSLACYFIFLGTTAVVLNAKALGLLAACTLGFFIGLADDAYNTRPFLKFSGQIVCALFLIITGTVITVFKNEYLNYLLTLLWVVGMMNSINMLDNMDGITASVSLAVCLGAICLLALSQDLRNIHFILLLGVSGALIGFLFFNWNPSKMFMGDTGSQFLGVFLSAMAIGYFWNAPETNAETVPHAKQLLGAVLAFLPALADTASVVINRLSARKSPFIGGRDHTTHHLSYMGLTDRQVATVFASISVISIALMIYLLHYIKKPTSLHLVIASVYIVVVFAFLFGVTKIKRSH